MLCFAGGCQRKSEITVYRIPKESSEVSMDAGTGRPGPDAGGPIAAQSVRWTPPDGWQEQPATGFRKGSYSVPGPDGQKADVSVVTFPSTAGGLLSNVNRWRDQLRLPPIAETDLKDAGSVIPVAGQNIYFIDLVSEQPMLDGGLKSRMLGGVLSLPNDTWFFKMVGPDSLVEAQKGAFQQFLQSLQVVGASLEASSRVTGTDVPTPRVEAPPAPALHYDLPAGWEEKPLTPMRVASFRIPGGADGDADASIVFLAGAAGGELSNVNRWRGQIALAPVSAEELNGLTTHIQARGHDFVMVDLLSNAPVVQQKAKERMLAAILTGKNQSWFVKLTGPDALVTAQRDAFIGLLKSLTVPE